MQVFMPYPCFIDSVGCLDTRRLINQVTNESYVMIRNKWPNHPAAQIWADHKWAMAKYCMCGLRELQARGAIKHSVYSHWAKYYGSWLGRFAKKRTLPPIMGYEPYHASHRSQLLAKAPRFYAGYGWKEPAGELAYVWTLPASAGESRKSPDSGLDRR